LLALTDRARSAWIARAVEYWRFHGFPFPQLSPSEIQSEYSRLENVDPVAILKGKVLSFSAIGLRLANAFHPQMWTVRLHDHAKSPLDHFADDVVLRKALVRAMHFWPNRTCWNAQCLRSVFRIYAGGRVANFRPTAARTLVSMFSASDATILDFSAGYGGRLLGTISLRRTYIGIDPHPQQYKGSKALSIALSGRAVGNANLFRARAESHLTKLPDHSVDMVLSSPPYFSHERYDAALSQSANRYSTYPHWTSSFLYPVLAHCQRILRPGGFLVININNTRFHPIADDARAFLGARLAPFDAFKLAMTDRPRESAADYHSRYEPVFVFRKAPCRRRQSTS